MAPLANPQHEEFARLLATGMKQGTAYEKAGYAAGSKSAASRLANSPEVVARVEHHKRQIARDVRRVMEANNDLEAWGDLARQGINLMWIADSYVTIYRRALEAQRFGDAVRAVENIVRLIQLEQNAQDAQETGGDKIAIKDTLALLGGLKDALRGAPALAPDHQRRNLLQYRAAEQDEA
ncbi:hypothetical protein [Pseudodonghicola sp.]|uniref:hypothetical protein n=1 Tax=Pseudodonghicola sp. TaxID=1969463 RepID=UPI003A984DDD